MFARIEKDFGVERGTLLALWGIESAYRRSAGAAEPHAPGISLARRARLERAAPQAYWETELINALRIVDKGWSTPEEMRGSWAGAMGHTQWMPEVWLNVGIDYDGDGQVSPFGKPDDALGRRHTIWSIAANIAAANIGATRCAPGAGERQPDLCGVGQRRRHPRRRPAVSATECLRANLDAGCGRTDIPAGTEFLFGDS